MAWLTVFNGSGHVFRIEGGGRKVWISGRGSVRVEEAGLVSNLTDEARHPGIIWQGLSTGTYLALVVCKDV